MKEKLTYENPHDSSDPRQAVGELRASMNEAGNLSGDEKRKEQSSEQAAGRKDPHTTSSPDQGGKSGKGSSDLNCATPDKRDDEPTQPSSGEDPFDPSRLRLTQDFVQLGGVRKQVVTVPVRKPTREEFVRVHPDPAYALDTMILEFKDSREIYLLDPGLRSELATESTVSARRLHTAIKSALKNKLVFFESAPLGTIEGGSMLIQG